jgi:hypothetical protein
LKKVEDKNGNEKICKQTKFFKISINHQKLSQKWIISCSQHPQSLTIVAIAKALSYLNTVAFFQ